MLTDSPNCAICAKPVFYALFVDQAALHDDCALKVIQALLRQLVAHVLRPH